MATYYVKPAADGGSDAAAGTSIGTAWATIGTALGAAGISSGDTVYIQPGTYREVVTVAMTSAVAETSIIGDVDGAKFGVAGPVIWSAYTTNDSTTPSTSACVALAGRNYLTFRHIDFVGGNTPQNTGSCVTTTAASNSHDIQFYDCTFQPGMVGGTNAAAIVLYNNAQTAVTWNFERCAWFAPAVAGVYLQISQFAGGADWDLACTFQNCLYVGNTGNFIILSAQGAANTFKPGGIKVKNCTVMATSSAFTVAANNHSTTVFSTIEHCLLFSGASAIISCATGQAVREDYNRVLSNTAVDSDVTAGGHSVTNITGAIVPALNAEFGQTVHVGQRMRAFLEPRTGSGLLGFAAGGNLSGQTTDFMNRPRPAGGAITAAVGYIERHDTATKETSVTDAGGVGIKITGPGDHDILIPVAAAATTITVRCRYDTNHGTGNKPQAILQTNGEIGVTTSTATAAAAVDTWETLTLGPFTPTAAGVVTVRLVSRSAAASGIAYFDSVTVA